MTNQIKTRVINKHDIEANWIKAINFIPLQGEIIVYDVDDNYNYERFKIGDGKTLINALPFADEALKEVFTQQVNEVNDKIDSVNTLVGNTAVSEQISTAIENIEILPTVTTSDAGKFLRVSSTGIWSAEKIPNAEEAIF